MKVIIKDKNAYLLRFDADEEVLEGLGNFCSTENISAGSFTALGAAKEIVLSYYNLETKKYQDIRIEKDVEIVGILGNVSLLNGQIIIHCHGSFSDETYAVKAGHVKRLIVSATCEVILNVLNGKVERTFDEKTGLNLMK